MAWRVVGLSLQMAVGDYGISLPVSVSGATFGEGDELRFTFNNGPGSNTILTKTYSNIQDNTVNLSFTEAESTLFRVGNYAYGMDWYQNGLFMCNVIESSPFRVVRKELNRA